MKEQDVESQGMVIIGVGYLFPMAAIWAAFDYWKMLFPDRNVEFAATAWYQVGSLLTVIFLSFQESLDFGPTDPGRLCRSIPFSFHHLPLPLALGLSLPALNHNSGALLGGHGLFGLCAALSLLAIQLQDAGILADRLGLWHLGRGALPPLGPPYSRTSRCIKSIPSKTLKRYIYVP